MKHATTLGLALLVAGCSASGGGSGIQGSGATNAGGALNGGGGSGGGIAIGGGSNVGGGGNAINCKSGPNDDADKDGFTPSQGDCNDCDANANPGAFDVAGNNIDEDCNNKPDDTQTSCDGNITDVAQADPKDGARAMGLCHFATPTDKAWGVIDARYVQADGNGTPNPVSHGLLTGFGPNIQPREGKRMLVLSSGTARQPTDAGYKSPMGFEANTTGTAPAGFPIDSPSCSIQTANDTKTYDPVALELKIRVPTNAKSFTFDFDFYTYEYPVYVCSKYNDFFVALQDPAPANAQSGNISFDSQKNPVSVNNGFLEVCSPQTIKGKTFPCALGTSELTGTGFDKPGTHAATGWLQTASPVVPGSIMTLRFAIWDMGDPILDSTVLIDKFQFSAKEAKGSKTTPVPK